jgi:hypothetical protein
MSLPSLYVLSAEMSGLMEQESVTDDDLQRVFGQIAEKASNIAQYVAVLDGQVDIFKAEEKRLSERRRAIENHQKRIKEYIKLNMESLGIDSLDAGTFTIKLQNNPEALNVTDENKLPARFIITETITKPDNAAIKAALKNGDTVPGAELTRGRSVRIR